MSSATSLCHRAGHRAQCCHSEGNEGAHRAPGAAAEPLAVDADRHQGAGPGARDVEGRGGTAGKEAGREG